MSAREREECMSVVLARDGYRCDPTMFGCGKTVTELIEIALAEEEITGKERKLPVVTIDHINNNSNQRDGIDGTYCRNVHILCWSCNRKKAGEGIGVTQSLGRDPSREKLDRLRYEPTYHRNVRTYLLDNEEICFIELKMGSKNFSDGGNEVTVLRYFYSELVTKANPKGRYQMFPHNCGVEHCNGNHVCLTGTKPERLLYHEKESIRRGWEQYYEGGDKEAFSKIRNEPFIDFEEYYNQHAVIGSWKFVTEQESRQAVSFS